MPLPPLDDYIKNELTQGLAIIGGKLETDVVTIISPIIPGLEHRLRQAIEVLPEHNRTVSVI